MAQYQVYFDTVEGEKNFKVEIDDHETIEDVIRGILGELAEHGHMMRGLSTGDLRVVWAGQGLALDLARTLPEQGVRPGDVLRVLVETYEAGGSMRADRVDREWDLLARLAALNPRMVTLGERKRRGGDDEFVLELRESTGLVSAHGTELERRDTHTVRLLFSRFYPDVPIECYVEEPLFHPNVKPENGFVCLWERSSARDTVVQAVARTQAMAAYRMVNMRDVHVMNAAAGRWYTAYGAGVCPLSHSELRVADVRDGQLVWLEPDRPGQRARAARIR